MGHVPYDLFHCLGSERQAWFIIVGSVGVVVWYLLIACYPWAAAVRKSTGDARKMGQVLILIFLTCGFCGYLPNVVSGWYPTEAYWMREVSLVLLNVLCPVFLIWSRHLVMLAEPKDRIEEAVNRFYESGETESEQLIRELHLIRTTVIPAKPKKGGEDDASD